MKPITKSRAIPTYLVAAGLTVLTFTGCATSNGTNRSVSTGSSAVASSRAESGSSDTASEPTTDEAALTPKETALCSLVKKDLPLLRDGDPSAEVEGLKGYATGGGGGGNATFSNSLAAIHLAAAAAGVDGYQLKDAAQNFDQRLPRASESFIDDSDAIVIGQQVVDMQTRCAVHDVSYSFTDTGTTAQDATYTWVTGAEPTAGLLPAVCKILASGDTANATTILKGTIPTESTTVDYAAILGAQTEVAANFSCPDQVSTAVDVQKQLVNGS